MFVCLFKIELTSYVVNEVKIFDFFKHNINLTSTYKQLFICSTSFSIKIDYSLNRDVCAKEYFLLKKGWAKKLEFDYTGILFTETYHPALETYKSQQRLENS